MPCELLVSRLGEHLWAALCEDGSIVEFYPPAATDLARVGQIFKARVTNVASGIQSAFLDIGSDREAFLHVRDLLLPGERPPAENGEEPSGANRIQIPIENRLSVGREILVQVVREPLSTKGARVSCYLSQPGRLLVLSPLRPKRAVSRRIEAPEERERLQAIVDSLPGGNVGYVARTASSGAAAAAIEAEAQLLLEAWAHLQQTAREARAPSVIQRESESLSRLLRDVPRQGLERIVVDETEDRDRAIEFLREVDPTLASRVRLHVGAPAMIEELLEQIELSLRPRVPLDSGGSLVIEETEALISIDVNSGKFLDRPTLEETALKTNLEAAAAIARQLRLRDIGGIVVVDFIDMQSEEHRREVVSAMEQGLRGDRAPTRVGELSEFGLLQLTRKRTRPGLAATLTRSCPTCAGRSRIDSAHLVAARFLHDLRGRTREGTAGKFAIEAHPSVLTAVRETGRQRSGVTLEFRENPAMHPGCYELQRVPD